MFNFISSKNTNKDLSDEKAILHEEKIKIDLIDYYYSNVVARASKTMSECRHIRLGNLKTGTEG